MKFLNKILRFLKNSNIPHDDSILNILKNDDHKNIYLKYYHKQINSETSEFDIDGFCEELGFTIDREVWLDVDIAGILNIKDKIIQANYFEGTLRQNFTIANLLGRYLLLDYNNKINIDNDIILFSYHKSQIKSQMSEIKTRSL